MIVEGAVGTVEMALERLNQSGVVELDEERKAAMVFQPFWWCSAATTEPSRGEHRIANGNTITWQLTAATR